MGESNQIKWVGARQIDPPEPFYVQNRPPVGDEKMILGSASNETKTILTIPTGHVYYIAGVLFCMYTSGNGYGNASIQNTVPTGVYYLGFGEHTTVGEYVISPSLGSLITMPAGYTIKLYSSAAAIIAFLSLQYFDETL